MKKFLLRLLILFPLYLPAQEASLPRDTLPAPSLGEALLLSQLTNGVVFSFNRYVTNTPFSHISAATISKNLDTGFVWDNDVLGTNFVGHPYHGGLYFAAARNAGFNFWESTPFVVAGSLVWEFFGENEPASTNDLIATSVAGVAFGEATYRFANEVFDSRLRGGDRLVHELVGSLISPMTGVKRLLTGEAYRYHSQNALRRGVSTRVDFSGGWLTASLAGRGEAPTISLPYVALHAIYGEGESWSGASPYDYFASNIRLQLGVHHELIGECSLQGLLCGATREWGKPHRLSWGLFQYFRYHELATSDEECYYYQFVEAASLGGALRLEGGSYQLSLHPSAILLGAVYSDYLVTGARNYNYGSGFGVEASGEWHPFSRCSLAGDFTFSRLYTPREDVLENPLLTENPLYANVMGNKGDFNFFDFSLLACYFFTPQWSVEVYYRRYRHSSHYRYYESRGRIVNQWQVGVGYRL